MLSTNPTTPAHDSFLDEIDRLVLASGLAVADLAAAVELPVAALSGVHRGIIRVPAAKISQLADVLGVDKTVLTRIWCIAYAPWILDLLHDLCPDVHRSAPHGICA